MYMLLTAYIHAHTTRTYTHIQTFTFFETERLSDTHTLCYEPPSQEHYGKRKTQRGSWKRAQSTSFSNLCQVLGLHAWETRTHCTRLEQRSCTLQQPQMLLKKQGRKPRYFRTCRGAGLQQEHRWRESLQAKPSVQVAILSRTFINSEESKWLPGFHGWNRSIRCCKHGPSQHVLIGPLEPYPFAQLC